MYCLSGGLLCKLAFLAVIRNSFVSSFDSWTDGSGEAGTLEEEYQAACAQNW